MAYYGSNYTQGGFAGNAYGAYGGGGGAYGSPAFPPSSGPPPPPGGGYGYGGSAYNVNSYNTYQMGDVPPPGGQHGMTMGGFGAHPGFGALPGFGGNFMNAMQQTQQMYRGPPPPQQQIQMPHSLTCDTYNNYMIQQQKAIQQSFLEQQKQLKAAMAEQKGETAAEEEEEDGGISEADRRNLKNLFVNECMRRLGLSGTFELTSGTVCGLSVYPDDDPVVKFASSSDGTGAQLAGKKWDPEEDCNYLRWAMKGLGTNEDAVIHVVATRNNAQRQQLKKMFKSATGRDLVEDLNSELSGNFRGAVLGCFVPPPVYDAWSIKEAIYGLGTDETSLIEIFMTRTNAQIREMVAAYPNVASPSRKASESLIEKDIKGDTSGYFKQLLIAATQGNRGEVSRERLEEAVEEVQVEGKGVGIFEVNYSKLADVEKATREAKLLFKAGEDCWGTDEETFIRIFSLRDAYQLRATWDEYVKITQRDIVNSVDRETSGSFKKGLRAIRGAIKCRPMFFAERLVQCIKGLGTNDDDLIRIVVSRSEIDMVQIKQCFLELTKQTLWKWINDDCSGDYKKLLQAIVGRD